jgi:hypothetical protein
MKDKDSVILSFTKEEVKTIIRALSYATARDYQTDYHTITALQRRLYDMIKV